MINNRNSVAVIGLGYIGLPTAAVLANTGYFVNGVDVDKKIVEGVNAGKIHIIEPDLDELVANAVGTGRLAAFQHAVPADIFLIAVPTPLKEGHQPDLSFIEAAGNSIAPHLAKNNLIILESTSPVGTTEMLVNLLSKLRPDLSFPKREMLGDIDVNVAYCPERVLPGFTVSELISNDRIIGGVSPRCSTVARNFYKTFVQGECIETDCRTAEMTKLTENAFRDVNIAFANELSLICDELEVNPWKLISLANRHPRVNVLSPGPGVGGHCIAVDPWFIVSAAPKLARMIRVAREVNDYKPDYILEKVCQKVLELNEKLQREISIGILGLSFKANIDDLRESPALYISKKIIHGNSKFGQIYVVEPNIEVLPEVLSSPLVKFVDVNEAVVRSDLLILLVDHKEFSMIDKSTLDGKSIIDTRGLWR